MYVRCSINANRASNVDAEIVVIESTIFAKSKPNHKHQAAEGMNPSDLECFVFDTLPEVERAGQEEENCEDGRRILVRRVKVNAAFD